MHPRPRLARARNRLSIHLASYPQIKTDTAFCSRRGKWSQTDRPTRSHPKLHTADCIRSIKPDCSSTRFITREGKMCREQSLGGARYNVRQPIMVRLG